MFSLHLRASALLALLATVPHSYAQTAASPATSAPTAQSASTDADSQGKVAYYGTKFNGRRTASGERFNAHALTMAHKTLPFGTLVRVTDVKSHRAVVVRVNDRGPTTPDRVGDLSLAAAQKLRMLHAGVTEAKLEVVGTKKVAKSAKHA